MKKYLVDVPVKINIWIRTYCQRKQWNVIKQARPSILFIQSDGGRNEEEWKAIRDNRKMIDSEIDWDCKVYRIYENKNNGLYAMQLKLRKLIWSKVDRCIFLEDDLIPSVSFFQYCADLLEKYKDDERIECICGFNNLGIWKKCTSDYFFSRQGSIWGTATWKRVIDQYGDFSYGNDTYIMNLLKERTKHNKTAWKRIEAYSKRKIYEGHVAGSEFYNEFFMYSQNRLQIVPRKNLISNIGATENSQHANSLKYVSKSKRALFFSPKYELTFPLKHPKYVIPDVEYEKLRNKLLGYNYPLINLKNKMVKTIYKAVDGDWSYIAKKIKEIARRKFGIKTEL